MKEEFDKRAGKINRTHVDAVLLTQSGYCSHRSWGFGIFKTVDTVFARFTIDFQTKAGHAMDLSFAAESLKPIDANHILAKKASGPRRLAQDGRAPPSRFNQAGRPELRRTRHY